ncbi:MAG: RNA polymerase sigma factor [Planctomycetes bacterium]|nr:RNA polymerase sigma factor [Planctomycetota bacterium]
MPRNRTHFRDGDAPATTERLIEHVDWLRRLARSVVSDPTDRDDAVQQTWLSALLHPPADGPGLRAWLKLVLLRCAARQRERGAWRARWENAAARDEAAPSAHEIAEHILLERELAQAVAELPEAQRVAVWMRFWEQLPPREIARRLEVPVETVRTRLKRALSALRGRLERTHGNDWKAALAPLAGLPMAFGAPAHLAGAVTTVALGCGGIALKTKLAAVVGVVLASMLVGTWVLPPAWLDHANESATTDDRRSEAPLERREGSTGPFASSSGVRRDRSIEPNLPDIALPMTMGDSADLIVRILDARGEPVNDLSIYLATERAKPDKNGERQVHYSTWRVEGKAPRHGIRIPASKLEDAFAKAREVQAEGQTASVRIKPSFTTPSCSGYEFAALEKPEGDIELRLEGSGFLRVEAMAPSGEVYHGDLSALVMVTSAEAGAERPNQQTSPSHSCWLSPSEPRIRVPLGKPLFVELWPRIHEFHRHSETIAGPLAEGEEVLLRYTLRPYAFLVGRLLSIEGEPLRAQRFHFSMYVGTGMSGGHSRTDTEGRFRLAISREPEPDKVDVVKFFPLLDGQQSYDTGELEKQAKATVENIVVPASGEHDLGDVRIAPSDRKILVSGVVVDELGQPLAGATLSAWKVWPLVRPWEEIEFLEDAGTSTKPDGTFEILSRQNCRAVLLSAAKDGRYLAKGVVAEIGRSDARLILHAGGSVSGALLLPNDFPWTAISVRCSHQDGRSDNRELDREGRFQFTSCRPGVHAIHIELSPWPALLEIRDILVDGAQPSADARLREIDLRQRLAVLRLRALDSSGAPLRHKFLEYSPDDRFERSKSVLTDADGLAGIALPVDAEGLAISLRDGSPAYLRWSPELQEARLAEPIELQLLLEPKPELPQGVFLSVRLDRETDASGASDRSQRRKQGSTFVDGKADCRVPTAGRYRMTWFAHTQAKTVELASPEPQSIEVSSDRASQSLRATPPAKELAEALEQWKR